jgi:triacylglycerol esterase/lipase EstA (alpha/beta hydrolase family)
MSGGGVSRVWADELGGAVVTRRLVTLGSPHHGTRAARFAAAFGPDVCPMACRQLVPSSDLLATLEETPDGPAWTAVWTAQDQVATPPESARLDGAVNVKVQDVCPYTRIGHGEGTAIRPSAQTFEIPVRRRSVSRTRRGAPAGSCAGSDARPPATARGRSGSSA